MPPQFHTIAEALVTALDSMRQRWLCLMIEVIPQSRRSRVSDPLRIVNTELKTDTVVAMPESSTPDGFPFRTLDGSTVEATIIGWQQQNAQAFAIARNYLDSEQAGEFTKALLALKQPQVKSLVEQKQKEPWALSFITYFSEFSDGFTVHDEAVAVVLAYYLMNDSIENPEVKLATQVLMEKGMPLLRGLTYLATAAAFGDEKTARELMGTIDPKAAADVAKDLDLGFKTFFDLLWDGQVWLWQRGRVNFETYHGYPGSALVEILRWQLKAPFAVRSASVSVCTLSTIHATLYDQPLTPDGLPPTRGMYQSYNVVFWKVADVGVRTAGENSTGKWVVDSHEEYERLQALAGATAKADKSKRTRIGCITVIVFLTALVVLGKWFSDREQQAREDRYPALYCYWHNCPDCDSSKVELSTANPASVFELSRTCTKLVMIPSTFSYQFDAPKNLGFVITYSDRQGQVHKVPYLAGSRQQELWSAGFTGDFFVLRVSGIGPARFWATSCGRVPCRKVVVPPHF